MVVYCRFQPLGRAYPHAELGWLQLYSLLHHHRFWSKSPKHQPYSQLKIKIHLLSLERWNWCCLTRTWFSTALLCNNQGWALLAIMQGLLCNLPACLSLTNTTCFRAAAPRCPFTHHTLNWGQRGLLIVCILCYKFTHLDILWFCRWTSFALWVPAGHPPSHTACPH